MFGGTMLWSTWTKPYLSRLVLLVGICCSTSNLPEQVGISRGELENA